ncbi:beta-glucanase (GH16 family) [Algoriphagus iocasae]|jgi:beta-glucanase (GH16 family)|uniref:Beta-glucanase (GH16 family) n=1 Tax=Algoriphagus iocasae TaxID=1836499 RepID=A0A841N119_9BACT|nr:glycoside hydrolase family 16 protein [Algoriphagus iocasae]MBB6327901.1 beta-glucanase (GH16 family) [Algoriphagus iocasae]
MKVQNLSSINIIYNIKYEFSYLLKENRNMQNKININLGLIKRRSRAYLQILFFPLILFTMSSCFENQGIEEKCEICISPPTYVGYNPLFIDEFNATNIDENWSFTEGNGCPDACGWGNGELQNYTDENIEIRNGNLVITAKKELDGQYTSGRISTYGTLSFTFGRIDVRARLPKGQGLWAAVWLLGNNIKEFSWPTPGHISLMELRGGEIEGRDNTIVGKIIWGLPNEIKDDSGFTSLKDEKLNDKFHVFSLIKEQGKIQWLIDDKVYFEKTIDSSMQETFSKPFHLIVNLAVGGQFPGNPDDTTVFPQEMVIDYIRVFQKQ